MRLWGIRQRQSPPLPAPRRLPCARGVRWRPGQSLRGLGGGGCGQLSNDEVATWRPPERDRVCRTVLRTYAIRYAVRMSSPTPQDKDTELRPLIDLLPRRRKRRSGADQATLSREQVVRVAIELADADGSEAISMR